MSINYNKYTILMSYINNRGKWVQWIWELYYLLHVPINPNLLLKIKHIIKNKLNINEFYRHI